MTIGEAVRDMVKRDIYRTPAVEKDLPVSLAETPNALLPGAAENVH